MDVRETIRRRISVRRYDGQPVASEVLAQVLEAGVESVPLIPEIAVRFHLFEEGPRVADRLSPISRTRILFGSAPHFIVAISKERPGFMENLGFRMEQMILCATALGLGTCWIGGMFEEKVVKELLGEEAQGYRVVALTPIGHPDPSWWGRAARQLIEAGTAYRGRRRPLTEIVFDGEWGIPWQGEGPLREVLELTRLAPSWANTQPWRFIVDGRRVIAAADTTPRWGNIRQGKAYYRLDTGIAMSHFFLSGRELGWEGEWQVRGLNLQELVARYHIPPHAEVIGLYELVGRWEHGRGQDS